jgi:hypothetical protein
MATEDIGDAVTNEIVEAFRNAPYNAEGRNTEHAMHDFKLPAFVRAFLVIHSLPATEKMILEEAGIDSPVYAKFEGQPCRLTLVSSMGDIGIAFDNRNHGYHRRGLSIYDMTDFSQTPVKGFPPGT